MSGTGLQHASEVAGVLIFSDPGAKKSACLMEAILRHYKLIYKKEVTKMDEMNNVTMENETSMMENAPARSSRSVLVLFCSSALV